jgi:hypothetical protein
LNSSVYRRRLRRPETASWSIVFTCPPIR